MSTLREITATDSCSHCGLRRATREFEQKGIYIRLCGDCYWGNEPQAETPEKSPAA